MASKPTSLKRAVYSDEDGTTAKAKSGLLVPVMGRGQSRKKSGAGRQSVGPREKMGASLLLWAGEAEAPRHG